MDHRINIELAEQRERQIDRLTRRRWPDDGLPPRHERSRSSSSLHPAAIIAEMIWR
jgi:hypothetical protein